VASPLHHHLIFPVNERSVYSSLRGWLWGTCRTETLKKLCPGWDLNSEPHATSRLPCTPLSI